MHSARLRFAIVIASASAAQLAFLPACSSARDSRLDSVTSVRFTSARSDERWTIHASNGEALCSTPCEQEIRRGTPVTIQKGEDRVHYEANADHPRTDVVVRPPRGSVLAPILIVPVGLALLIGGIAVSTHRTPGSCGSVLGGPPCPTDPPDIATGIPLTAIGGVINNGGGHSVVMESVGLLDRRSWL